jgi:predicted transcriptional regulator
MSRDIELHIGGSFDDAAKRVADAWHRAEKGEAVSEDHLTFVSWEAFSHTMTAKRLELLRYLHRHPQTSIAALAKSLKRDYRRVHEDVEILSEAGLVERDEKGIRAGYDEIRTVIAL